MLSLVIWNEYALYLVGYECINAKLFIKFCSEWVDFIMLMERIYEDILSN